MGLYSYPARWKGRSTESVILACSVWRWPHPMQLCINHNWLIIHYCHIHTLFLIHLSLLQRSVISQGTSKAQEVLGATQVAPSALRAVIVLNGLWLRPVWFSYSRSPQFERIPNLPKARTEVTGYSCKGNRADPLLLNLKCQPTLLPWAVLRHNFISTNLFWTFHSSIIVNFPQQSVKSFPIILTSRS